MGKVVTSAGLNEFVQSGKVEVIERPKGNGAAPSAVANPAEAQAPPAEKPIGAPPAPEAKPAEKPPEKPAEAAPAKPEESGTEDTDLTPEELKLAGERFTRVIGQKHRRMREAQEAAQEAEGFAESQFKERRLVEAERDQLKARVAELEKSGKPAAAAPEKKKPAPEDFRDDKGQVKWPEYTEAVATYAAEEATAKERARIADEQARAAAERAQMLARERFNAAKERYPDFEQTIERAKEVLIQNSVLVYIGESEKGPDLSYFLAKHPEEVEKIVKLSPMAAVAYVGRLEAGLEIGKPSGAATPSAKSGAAPAVAESTRGAPAPITPLGNGSGTVPKDPSTMTFRELREYERSRVREAARR